MPITDCPRSGRRSDETIPHPQTIRELAEDRATAHDRPRLRQAWIALVSLVAIAPTTLGAEEGIRPAREFYLDSRAGSDAATGGKRDPWRSLDRLALVVFAPGDTVCFVGGSEFEGGFTVDQSGTAESPITFKAAGEGPPARLTNPRSRVLDGNAIRVNASHIVIDGLFFEHCPTNPVATDVHLLGAVFLTDKARHCIVRNCEMTQTPIGVSVYGEHNLVTGNSIHDNDRPIQPKWGPMCIVVCGSHNEVSYNRLENYAAPSREFGHDGGAIEINDRRLPKRGISIHHNFSARNQGFIEWVGGVTQDDFHIHHNISMDYQQFLGFTGPCTNHRIEHNTVVRVLAHADADSEDVVFWNYDHRGANAGIVFRNNIFVFDPARVEPIFARGRFESSHNLFYRTDHDRIPPQANGAAYQRKYLGGGAHLGRGERFGDPLFRDLAGGDFRLRPGSPAVDAGEDLGHARDFDDRPRCIGAAPDLGAIELVPDDEATSIDRSTEAD